MKIIPFSQFSDTGIMIQGESWPYLPQYQSLSSFSSFFLRSFQVLYHVLFLAIFSSIFNVAAQGEEKRPPVIFTQIPRSAAQKEPFQALRLRNDPPAGSRIVLLNPGNSGGKLTVLTEGFAAACDPCVSFDGKRLLFAARRTSQDNWNIWETAIDGFGTRQITKDLGDCREPAYLAKSAITPPDFTDKVRWIVFTSTSPGTYAENSGEIAPSLYVCNIEPIPGRGTVTWRATFNLSHDFSPTVLSDGRILFSSWQNHGSRTYPQGMVALMTINWAGTGLNAFYGNHQGATIKSMACEMPDRTLIFVESDEDDYGGGGRLARISFKRPLHSYESLSTVIDGRFATPHPYRGGKLCVSYAAGEESYGIYLFDPKKKTLQAKIFDDPDWNEMDPLAVVAREEPLGRITTVVDSKETGHLQCLNVYESDRLEAQDIKLGDVKRVRFIEGVPIAKSDLESVFRVDTQREELRPIIIDLLRVSGTRILGEAEVEADGSFLVEIVADTPFFMQTLDKHGMALQTMGGWMWVRRGSRRGCIGCHENKELAPENRATDALLKAIPESVTSHKENRRTVIFKRDIMPIIKRRCMACHGGTDSKGGLDLSKLPTKHFNQAYESLLQADPENTSPQAGTYVYLWNARKSPLIHLLYGWEDSTGDKSMPPHSSLPSDERKKFAEWIDLGAQWDFFPGMHKATEASISLDRRQ